MRVFELSTCGSQTAMSYNVNCKLYTAPIFRTKSIYTQNELCKVYVLASQLAWSVPVRGAWSPLLLPQGMRCWWEVACINVILVFVFHTRHHTIYLSFCIFRISDEKEYMRNVMLFILIVDNFDLRKTKQSQRDQREKLLN